MAKISISLFSLLPMEKKNLNELRVDEELLYYSDWEIFLYDILKWWTEIQVDDMVKKIRDKFSQSQLKNNLDIGWLGLE